MCLFQQAGRCLRFAALYWIYDVQQAIENPVVRALTKPLQIFGANALPVYVISLLGHKTARTIHLQQHGHSVSLRHRGVPADVCAAALDQTAFTGLCGNVRCAVLCAQPAALAAQDLREDLVHGRHTV